MRQNLAGSKLTSLTCEWLVVHGHGGNPTPESSTKKALLSNFDSAQFG